MASATALAGVGFLAGALFGAPAFVDAEPRPNPYERLTPLSKVLSYIERSYVDPVDQGPLIDAAIKGMVGSLDPHSVWMTPAEYAAIRREHQGDFVGVGLELAQRGEGLTVITAIEGAPAEKAGVRSGDILTAIDGTPSASLTPQQAIVQLRGPEGSQVSLELKRIGAEGSPKRLTIEVKRAFIQLDAVVSQVLSPKVGYIRVRAFQEGVVDDIKVALGALEAQTGGLEGLVVDLRNNPGGFFLEAVQVADLFMESGLIVTTRGRGESSTEVFKARADTAAFQAPLAVLINRGSASSSELLAGALKDQGRAALIGEQSFGKGSVQTFVELKDGSALKLTTARYITPSNLAIEGRGIAPDIEVVQPAQSVALAGEDWQTHDAQLRMAHAHLKSFLNVDPKDK